ncbi:MAG: peroxidase-related enzyme [Gammaproteobacteria bacterium]|nr:peroxidase-related enzyme [Gammaproteobacteria bacterium]
MADNSKDTRPCWIDSVDPSDASVELAAMYAQVGAVHNKIHNLYRAFSLQPAPLLAADQHYRDVLHDEGNCSDPWFLELLASQAAIIADCHYALANHGANFKTLLGDTERGDAMLAAVREDAYAGNPLFTPRQAALLVYGARLCRTPESMREADIEALRAEGISDSEILEAVQATACFAYWVRFINALGVQLGNESIGKYDNPSAVDQ